MFHRLLENFKQDDVFKLMEYLRAGTPYPTSLYSSRDTLEDFLKKHANISHDAATRITRGDPSKECEQALGLDEDAASALLKECQGFVKVYAEVQKALPVHGKDVVLHVLTEFAQWHLLRSPLGLSLDDVPAVVKFYLAEYQAMLQIICRIAQLGRGESGSIACAKALPDLQSSHLLLRLLHDTDRGAETAFVLYHGSGNLAFARQWVAASMGNHAKFRTVAACVMIVVDAVICPVKRDERDLHFSKELVELTAALVDQAGHPDATSLLHGYLTILNACLLSYLEPSNRQHIFCTHFAKALQNDFFTKLADVFRGENLGTLLADITDAVVQSTFREVSARLLHQCTYSVNNQFWQLLSPSALRSVGEAFHSLRENITSQIRENKENGLSQGIETFLETARVLLPVPDYTAAFLYMSSVLDPPYIPTAVMEAVGEGVGREVTGSALEGGTGPDVAIYPCTLRLGNESATRRVYCKDSRGHSPSRSAGDVVIRLLRIPTTAVAFFDVMSQALTEELSLASLPPVATFLQNVQGVAVFKAMLASCFNFCREAVVKFPRISERVSSMLQDVLQHSQLVRRVSEYEARSRVYDISLSLRMLFEEIVRACPTFYGAMTVELLAGEDSHVTVTASTCLAVSARVLLLCAKVSRDFLYQACTDRRVYTAILQHLAMSATAILQQSHDAEPLSRCQRNLADACTDFSELLCVALSGTLLEEDEGRHKFGDFYKLLVSSGVFYRCHRPLISILMELLCFPDNSVNFHALSLLTHACRVQNLVPGAPSIVGCWSKRHNDTFAEALLYRAHPVSRQSSRVRACFLHFFFTALETQRTLMPMVGSCMKAVSALSEILCSKDKHWDVVAPAVQILVRLYEGQTDNPEVADRLQPLSRHLYGSLLEQALNHDGVQMENSYPDRLITITAVMQMTTVFLFRSSVAPAEEQNVRNYMSQMTPRLVPIDQTASKSKPIVEADANGFVKACFDGKLVEYLRFVLFMPRDLSRDPAAGSMSRQSSATQQHLTQTPRLPTPQAPIPECSRLTLMHTQSMTPLLHTLGPRGALRNLPIRFDPLGSGRYYFDDNDLVFAQITPRSQEARLLENASHALTSLQASIAYLRGLRDFLIMYFDKKDIDRRSGKSSDYMSSKSETNLLRPTYLLTCVRLLLNVIGEPISDPFHSTISSVDEMYRETCAHLMFIICDGFFDLDDFLGSNDNDAIEEIVTNLHNVALAGLEQSPAVVKWIVLAIRKFHRRSTMSDGVSDRYSACTAQTEQYHASLFPVVVHLLQCPRATKDVQDSLLSYVVQLGPGPAPCTAALVESQLEVMRRCTQILAQGQSDEAGSKKEILQAWGTVRSVFQVLTALASQPFGVQILFQHKVMEKTSSLNFRTLLDHPLLRVNLHSLHKSIPEVERIFAGSQPAHLAWLSVLGFVNAVLLVLTARNKSPRALNPSDVDIILGQIECFIDSHQVQFAVVCMVPFPRDTYAVEAASFTEVADAEESELVASILMLLGFFRSHTFVSTSRPLFPWILPLVRHGLLTVLETRGEKLYQKLKNCYLKSSLDNSGVKGMYHPVVTEVSSATASMSLGRSGSSSRSNKLAVIVHLRVQLEIKIYSVMRSFLETLLLHSTPATDVSIIEYCNMPHKLGSVSSQPQTYDATLSLVPTSSKKDCTATIDVCLEVVKKSFSALERCVRATGADNREGAAFSGLSPPTGREARPSRERSVTFTERHEDQQLWGNMTLTHVVVDVLQAAVYLLYAHVEWGNTVRHLPELQRDVLEKARRSLIAELSKKVAEMPSWSAHLPWKETVKEAVKDGLELLCGHED